jgi:D-glycero-alpha-D-manno-heptose-7-phosphate kinase
LAASPCFQFLPDDRVIVEPLKIPGETLANLEDNLPLFFAGNSRNASDILRDQDSRTKQNNTENAGKSSLHQTIGTESRDALLGGDLNGFADLMNTPWEHKQKRSPGGESGHERSEEPSRSSYLLLES